MKKSTSTLLILFIFLLNTQLSAQTTNFSYTGNVQTYIVPASVTSLTVTVRGAQGASPSGQGSVGYYGGNGGSVQCLLAVTPGQTLYLYVGGAGNANVGGYHGGADGTQGSATAGGNTQYFSGGGGGGASEICIGGPDITKVVAGGGGGGGGAILSGGSGGNGGTTTGQDGAGISGPPDDYSGKGGTPTEGGWGGFPSGFSSGYAFGGSRLNGGAGGVGGGGGGGGYYGGGGGNSQFLGPQNNSVCYSSAGGGGGSSWVDPTLSTNTTMTRGENTGNGSIAISIGVIHTPTITVVGTTNTAPYSSIMTGFVNDNGGAITNVVFEYFKSNLPANTVTVAATPSTIAAGTGNTAVSAQAINLEPGTYYNFRIKATTDGITYASGYIGGIFTQNAPLPTATTLPATQVYASNAQMNATVNGNGSAVSVSFEYSYDPALLADVVTVEATGSPLAAGTGNTAVSANAVNLYPNSTWYYRVKAGTVSGSILSFNTTSAGTPVVTTQTPASITTNSAILKGTANDNGGAAGVSFQYSTSPTLTTGVTTVPMGNIDDESGTASFQLPISSLSSNTTYYYRITAGSSFGTSNGTIVSFTTLANVPGTYITKSNGNWNNPATWEGNIVPTQNSQVEIKHTVTLTANATCYSLKMETTGNIILNTGFTLTISQ